MRKKSLGSVNDNARNISRHTAYQRNNPREGSPHYVLLYSDDENEDESIPLKPRKQNNTNPRKVEVINVTLKPDDTLRALALHYRCTISELKRINNIHKENEIFARRSIKVPVQQYSIFTESNDIIEPINSTPVANIHKTEEQIINLVVNPIVLPSTSNDINNIILNSVCEPVATNNDCTNINEGDDDENDELLRSSDRDSTPEARVVDSFRCSGADWGLSWAHLLGLSLLLGIVLPVIYIFHIAENHQTAEAEVLPNRTLKENIERLPT